LLRRGEAQGGEAEEQDHDTQKSGKLPKPYDLHALHATDLPWQKLLGLNWGVDRQPGLNNVETCFFVVILLLDLEERQESRNFGPFFPFHFIL
jgi:hypothetical protein